MAFRDTWHRALVYFGLAEEHEEMYEPEPPHEPEVELEDRYRERPNVRRLPSRSRRDATVEIFAGGEPPRSAGVRSVGPCRGPGRGGGGRGQPVVPRSCT